MVFTAPAHAQFQFRNLSVSQGLSQNSVVSIAQDKNGFMWFATQDGLCRYNGDFKIYQQAFEDDTRTNYKSLGQVYSDRSGNLFAINQERDLLRYDYQQDMLEVARPGSYLSIYQDTRFNYWLTTAEHKLIVLKDLDSTPHVLPKLCDCRVYQVFDDGHQIEVITDAGRYLVTSTPEGHWQLSKGLDTHLDFSDIALDHNGTHWYSTFSHGLFFRQKEEPVVRAFLPEGMPDGLTYYNIEIDSSDRIWAGTYGGGLISIESDRSTVHRHLPNKSHPFAVSYHDILDLHIDRTGLLWAGTDGSGVDYYDEFLQRFSIITNETLPSGINVDVIRAIEKSNDFLVIGTSGKGITYRNQGSGNWTTVEKSDGLLNSRIMSLAFDDNDRLWIGHQFDGLTIAHFEQESLRVVKEALEGHSVWSILKGANSSTMWLGTNQNKLVEFHISRGILREVQLPASNGNLRALCRHRRLIFIGTDLNGLFSFDPATTSIKSLGNRSPLIQKIKSLTRLDDQHLLVGTNGSGLVAYDLEQDRVTQLLSMKNGLANNVIYGMHVGDQNDLWVSTNRGISQLLLDLSSDTINASVVKNYDVGYGLQSYEFNTGAHLKDDQGFIHFGGIDGLNTFHPEVSIRANAQPYNTHIHTIDTPDSTYLPSSDVIRLAPGKNSFTVHIYAGQYSLPDKTMYAYRLRGFEQGWLETDQRDIAYMNIAPGKYVFEVKSSNYDNTWSGSVASQAILVKQHWYLTNTFRLIAIGFILAALYYLRQTEKRRLQIANRLEQNRMKSEYLEKINETRATFYSNLTHEFRTPLTIISGLVKRLSIPSDKKEVILRNSDNLLTLVNQMLDLSKIESGMVESNTERVEIISFLRRLTDSFNSYALDNKISLNFHSEIDEIQASIEQEKYKMILNNLISNAIKYTPEYGQILVTCNVIDALLYLTVSDTGIGLSSDDQARVFDRFYQVNMQADAGTGIGLSIVRELIESLEGSITLRSHLNRGSKFEITLPIDLLATESLDAQTEKSTHDPLSATVLIIDDNLDLLDYMFEVVSGEYNVIRCNDSGKALELASNVTPDLIITDVMMPAVDGMTLTRLLKENEVTSHIPVIMVTAKIEQVDRLEGLNVGANAYMTKPFDEIELLTRIRVLLKEREILHQFYARNRSLPEEKPVENKVIAKIDGIVKKNIGNERFSVAELANEMAMDRSQLYRKVKALTGKTPSEIIRAHRMTEAHKLLSSSSGQSIGEVAFACGFSDPSYFSQVFKQTFGYRPSETLNQS